jgi:surface protein
MIEDFEYSRGKMGSGAVRYDTVFKNNSKIKYAPYINASTGGLYQSFVGCSNLVSAVVPYVPSGNSAFQGFYNCSKLKRLNTSNWDTSGLVNLQSTFQSCESITSLDVSNWNTSNVTNMQSMFNGCSKLESLDVSKWDVGKVTNMASMFLKCENIKSIGDTSGWNLSNVVDCYQLFQNCYVLEKIDCSGWYAPKCKQMDSMFMNLRNVKEIDLSSWDLTTVQYMSTCFATCYILDVLRLKNFGGHPDFKYDRTFNGCTELGSTDEGLEAMRNTLIRDSFDRASAGYSSVTISLPSAVKARLTTDEIAQITAKGFTIT